MTRSRTFKPLLTLLMVLVTSLPALAHKVRIFAWEDGNAIVTESQFNGGRPAKNATVSVVDTTSGQQLLSGTTDAEGVFRFPLPAAAVSEMKITVDGGEGHKNSWLFSMDENTSDPDTSPHTHLNTTVPGASQATSLTKDELQYIVEDALDKKLGPIKRTLAESTDQGPTLQDILGGIGYILGLAGIGAYFQSRKKEKE